MVSSFIILTNIQVPTHIAKSFNENFSPYKYNSENIYEDMEKYDISVSSYFDTVLLHKDGAGGVKSLDIFLEKECSSCIDYHNWMFDENNTLWDCCEKFHGAISVLEFFIERFFKPHSVLLNGTIMAVNTECPMGYVYHIKDNVISLDESLTRKMLLELEEECSKEEKHYQEKDYDYYFNRQDFLNQYFNDYKDKK
jgi:hypothetical protein